MGTLPLRLVALLSVVQQVTSWSISTPSSVSAVEGSCVLVPCQTQPHSRVIWYQYHSLNYPVVYDGVNPRSVEYQFIGRTSVPGEASQGNCSLLIENVNRKDDHLQVYVWINPDGKANQKFHQKTVNILVERTAPTISLQPEIVEGNRFQVSCSINFSCRNSPPSLHWGTSPSLEAFNLTRSHKSLSGQWQLEETLSAVATNDMHNRKMRCSARFRTFTSSSKEITLNILYKPANVTATQENRAVTEGGNVDVSCAVNSNPRPHAYSWLRRHSGHSSKIAPTQRKVTLYGALRSTSVSCLAHNSMGVGQSDWLELEFQYAPTILPESSCNLTAGVLKCVCVVDASPAASINWVVDKNHTLQSSFVSALNRSKTVLTGEISVPEGNHTRVSCHAENSLGNDSRRLYVRNQSKSSSLLVWLMLAGSALVLGCALFIYRKYPKERTNHETKGDKEIECSALPRSHHEDVHSDLAGQPEEDREPDVYDNDFLLDMRRSLPDLPQQRRDNAVAAQSRAEPMAAAKEECCNMEIYGNC